MTRALFLAGALLVSACAGQATQTARQAVASSAVLLEVAATAFDAYARLPRCGRPGAPEKPLCSDPKVVAELGPKLDLVAATIAGAQAVVNTLPEHTPASSVPAVEAAQSAVAAVTVEVNAAREAK
jgi:hypothetical protein